MNTQEEQLKRMEVLTRLGKFIAKEFYVSSKCAHVTYSLLCGLLANDRPTASNRMQLIQELRIKDPQLLVDLIPYLDPESTISLPFGYTPLAKKKGSW